MRNKHTFFMKNLFIIVVTFILIRGISFKIFAAGLPEEFLLTERWRLLFSGNSPLTNPTFINEENYISLRFTGTSIFGEFLTSEVGLVYPIGLYQSAGLTWLHQGLRKPYLQTYLENGVIKEGGNVPDNTEYFMLTYAYNPWAGLTVGANLNVLWKAFFDYSNIGISPDLGLSYRLIHNPLIGTHIFGINVQNAIYIKTSEFEELPRVIRFSLNSTYLERQIESTFDFSLRDIGVSPAQFINSPNKLEWNLDGKIGGWILRFAKIYGLFGIKEDAFSYFGFAGGFNIPMVNNGRDLSFLIQYLNIMDVEDKSPASFLSLYLKTDIGLHREEIYARKMAKLANLQPNELYIKACNLYAQGNYWDAFFIFSQLFVEYPDFFKNDWVAFFLGSCQEEMDMRLTAEEAYKKMKEMYPRSAAVPFSDLGLMRIYYRDGNFGAVEEQFNELNKLGVPDSIKYHAYYYMGQTEMKKSNFAKAKQLFEFIPETHPDYVFAQHSAAVCDAATDNIEGTISSLENCIQVDPKTPAQKEIVYRSYVFLGYIFYEELTKQEGPLAKAVTALRMVPKGSYFYPDALLGLGWTALKARQWGDCKVAGQELVSATDNPVMKAEGYLLQAYAYMMEKDYNSAVTVLSEGSKLLENFQPPSTSQLMTRQDESNALRGKYTDVARKAYELATVRQSDVVLKQIDSLHNHQKEIKAKLDDFLKYVDNFERNTFFGRYWESVKDDIDYALAKAQKLGGQKKSVDEMKKIQEQDKKLDEELKQLEKQLEEEKKKSSKKAMKEESSNIEEPKKEPKKSEKKEVLPSPTPSTPTPPIEEELPDLPEEEGWE